MASMILGLRFENLLCLSARARQAHGNSFRTRRSSLQLAPKARSSVLKRQLRAG